MRTQIKKWLASVLQEIGMHNIPEDRTDLRTILGELNLLSILAAAEYEFNVSLVKLEKTIRTVGDLVDIICLKKSAVTIDLSKDEIHLMIEMATDYRQKCLKQLEAVSAPEINEHTHEKFQRAKTLSRKLHDLKI
jgi:hypothetical protein